MLFYCRAFWLRLTRSLTCWQAVIVNLRIETDEARRLGLENHVCEVQLLMRPFAPLPVRVEPDADELIPWIRLGVCGQDFHF